LRDLVIRLDGIVSRYRPHFTSRTRTVIGSVSAFLTGIFLADRSNLQQIAESQEAVDRQNLQYLLSEASWDHQKVQDQISLDADKILGGQNDSMLILDESGFSKKGKHSAGVGRQWNGRLGKVDNCQVGVFAALCRGNAATLVQAQLYLPKDWTDDPKRCAKAGIPEAKRSFRSKSTICLEMVRHTRMLGIRYAWVGADAGYGKEPGFLRKLADAGERFMVDLHSTQRIYTSDPKPFIPSAQGVRGKKPSRLITNESCMTVQSWAKDQPESAWENIKVRHTTLGILNIQALRCNAWFWDNEEYQARQWTLLVIREVDRPDEISYSVSNASPDISIQEIVQAQRQRFWIENSFGEAKSELGLDEYEFRSWLGWHRHITLCMLGQLFVTEQRLNERDALPMLSTRDLCTAINALLIDPEHSFARSCQVIEERQSQRWKSQMKRYKMQGETPIFMTFGNSTM
jgi:SRSO17 transposase